MSPFFKAFAIGLTVAAFGLLIGFNPVGLGIEENVALDVLFNMRGTRSVPAEVVIVSIDNTSAESFQVPPKWKKWPRSLHARLIDKLAQAGAALIVLDVVFDEEGPADEDRQLADAIARAGCVVLCESLESNTLPLTAGGSVSIERLVPPIPLFAQAAAAAAPFPLPKVPVRVNQYWTFKATAGDKPTLPVAAFELYSLWLYGQLLQSVAEAGGSRPGSVRDASLGAVQNGNGTGHIRQLLAAAAAAPGDACDRARLERMLASLRHLEQGPDRSLYLNFYGPPGTIPTVPLHHVLQDGQAGITRVLPHFKGKAVFVGLSELQRIEQSDGFHTVFSQPDGIDLSGVEIAATAFANLLENMPLRPLDIPSQAVIVVLWGLLLAFVCGFTTARTGAVLTAALSGLYFWFARHQFNHAGVWLPLTVPLLVQAPAAYFATMLYKYVETNRERRNIRKAFNYYLPESEVDRLANDLTAVRTNSRIIHGTCLVTDAVRYTNLSEGMDPRALSTLMNQYYEVVLQPVKRHGGMVTDMIGDSMLALWVSGDPAGASTAAVCQAALDIAAAVNRFNQCADRPPLPTRIGLHAGSMSLGNIGGADRYEFTPVGDVVNTASRIEGLNRYLGTNVLVSEQVADCQDVFLTRELGQFLLAGKSRAITIHELICRRDEADERQKGLCTIFTEALRAYRCRRFDEARAALQEVLHLFARDGPALFYLDLCDRHQGCPPPEEWDGLVCMETK